MRPVWQKPSCVVDMLEEERYTFEINVEWGNQLVMDRVEWKRQMGVVCIYTYIVHFALVIIVGYFIKFVSARSVRQYPWPWFRGVRWALENYLIEYYDVHTCTQNNLNTFNKKHLFLIFTLQSRRTCPVLTGKGNWLRMASSISPRSRTHVWHAHVSKASGRCAQQCAAHRQDVLCGKSWVVNAVSFVASIYLRSPAWITRIARLSGIPRRMHPLLMPMVSNGLVHSCEYPKARLFLYLV
jgi:hypothetical protein